jgi:hypothetical protein
MHLNELTDESAIDECRRLLFIISARKRELAQWFGDDDAHTIAFEENSAFAMGMISMFRYARGMDIPPFVVRDFIDELLKLMFGGLASGSFALPPFRRMTDKPWAIAWRIAELRLAAEGSETIDIPQLAHLLGTKSAVLADHIHAHFPDAGTNVPQAFLDEMIDAFKQTDGDIASCLMLENADHVDKN